MWKHNSLKKIPKYRKTHPGLARVLLNFSLHLTLTFVFFVIVNLVPACENIRRWDSYLIFFLVLLATDSLFTRYRIRKQVAAQVLEELLLEEKSNQITPKTQLVLEPLTTITSTREMNPGWKVYSK